MDSGDNSMDTVKNDKQDNKIYISKDGATKEPSKKQSIPIGTAHPINVLDMTPMGKIVKKLFGLK